MKTPKAKTPELDLRVSALELVKAIKPRVERMKAMAKLRESGKTLSEIGRQWKLTPAEVLAQLKEYGRFVNEAGLTWRIFYSDIPGTTLRGDKGRWKKLTSQLNAYYKKNPRGYVGPAAEATLHNAGVRNFVIGEIFPMGKRWENA
jgi:hypothetical protein